MPALTYDLPPSSVAEVLTRTQALLNVRGWAKASPVTEANRAKYGSIFGRPPTREDEVHASCPMCLVAAVATACALHPYDWDVFTLTSEETDITRFLEDRDIPTAPYGLGLEALKLIAAIVSEDVPGLWSWNDRDASLPQVLSALDEALAAAQHAARA